jgi:hypothetical protein
MHSYFSSYQTMNESIIHTMWILFILVNLHCLCKILVWRLIPSLVGVTIRQMFRLDIRFIDHLYNTLGATRNDSIIADLHFTVHRYTWTRILSLHLSYPGNGFITVLLSLHVTHEVLFSQPNSFLTIILQLPTKFNSKLISRLLLNTSL